MQLGLYRACLKDAQQVLSVDPTNGNALLLQIRANEGIGKDLNSKTIVNDWIEHSGVQYLDVFARVWEVSNEKQTNGRAKTIPTPTIENEPKLKLNPSRQVTNIPIHGIESRNIDFKNVPIDKLLIIGNYKVNNGLLNDAVEHFTMVLKEHPTVPQA